MDYLEFQFRIDPPQPASEILIAELGNVGFESFVENEDGITAYIQKDAYEPQMIEEINILKSDEFKIEYSSKEITQVNWNEEWEKNFQPITVDDICTVRAPFHPNPDVKYDIVIEPKMSFGTGHHATTHMMIQYILSNDFEGKTVLDIGCGTGVLAILASKKGAAKVDAIDIDNWCYLNSLENVARNEAENIHVFEGGAELIEGKKYDVIIANINRNILLKDMNAYAEAMNKNATLFLSGFYAEDIPAIEKICDENGLNLENSVERDHWVALKFSN